MVFRNRNRNRNGYVCLVQLSCFCMSDARAYVCMYAHAWFNQATKRWLLLTVCLNLHTISDDFNERLRLKPKLNIVSFECACEHFDADQNLEQTKTINKAQSSTESNSHLTSCKIVYFICVACAHFSAKHFNTVRCVHFILPAHRIVYFQSVRWANRFWRNMAISTTFYRMWDRIWRNYAFD